MRIAFFVSGFPCISETFIVNQITGLIDRGHDVDIYADEIHGHARLPDDLHRYHLLDRTYCRHAVQPARRWQRLVKRVFLAAKNVWRYPGVVFRSLNVFTYGIRAITLDVLDRALFFIGRPSYDIVHCHFGQNGIDAAILIDLGLLKGKLVTTFHGYDIREGIARMGRVYDLLIKHCDAVHSISQYNRKHLEAFGFDRNRIIHHPMGIDLKRFQPPQNPGMAETVTILTVARLVREKGFQLAFQALADVRTRRSGTPIRYRIIGEGGFAGSLQSLMRELGLEDVVEFLGAQDQTMVATTLSHADLFLLPSLAEAMPVSIMEAMACALPVVATDVGSVAELVRDGQTGRLVPPADSRALADALIKLLDERESWPRLGQAGRAIVTEKYNLDILNDYLVEHYRLLLAASCSHRERDHTHA